MPEARYFSMPSTVSGADARRKRALNCWPWMRSFTHSPDAVIHSPAAIVAACPITVTRSGYPRAFARNTQNPLSALWKVTRSTRPASTSWVDDCGCEFIGTIISATFARTYESGTDMAISSPAIRLNGHCAGMASSARWTAQHGRRKPQIHAVQISPADPGNTLGLSGHRHSPMSLLWVPAMVAATTDARTRAWSLTRNRQWTRSDIREAFRDRKIDCDRRGLPACRRRNRASILLFRNAPRCGAAVE